jgi:ATP-dependent RNA circularization protein (DNA/RNA ligase family)
MTFDQKKVRKKNQFFFSSFLNVFLVGEYAGVNRFALRQTVQKIFDFFIFALLEAPMLKDGKKKKKSIATDSYVFLNEEHGGASD